MDNLTHTLIGVSTAHALPKKWRKPSVYWALVLGNNFPDADVIQSLLPGQTPLDYLVHHRGYTHTFISAPILAGAVAFLASLLAGERGKISREIYLFSLLGCLMHVSADFLNNYGVHPLSPFWNRWFYGDTLFIVEPLIWMTLLPVAMALAVRKSARVFWGSLLLLATGLLATTEMMAAAFKLSTAAFGLLSLYLHHRDKSPIPGLITVAIILTLFGGASFYVRNEVRERLAMEGIPREQVLGVDASPSPGNPLCWGSWARLEYDTEYRTRYSHIAVIPRLVSSESCERRNRRTLTFEPGHSLNPVKNDRRFRWAHQVITPKADMEHLHEYSCEFRRAMTFYRFPHVRRLEDGNWSMTDLRYDRGGRRAFATYALGPLPNSPVECPQGNEPWQYPTLRNQNQ